MKIVGLVPCDTIHVRPQKLLRSTYGQLKFLILLLKKEINWKKQFDKMDHYLRRSLYFLLNYKSVCEKMCADTSDGNHAPRGPILATSGNYWYLKFISSPIGEKADCMERFMRPSTLHTVEACMICSQQQQYRDRIDWDRGRALWSIVYAQRAECMSMSPRPKKYL